MASLTLRAAAAACILLALASSLSHAFLIPRPALAGVRRPTPSPSARQPGCHHPSTATALNYASQASSDPMAKADANKGGCPFLDTTYVYKTWAVPALFSEKDSRPIVLFDGDCNLCNNFVQTLLKYDADERGNLRFAALQSRVGDLLLRRMSDELRAQVISPDAENESDDEEGAEQGKYLSIVVCGADTTYIRSSAVFQILRSLGGSSKRLKVVQYLAMLGYVLPTRVRDGLYKFVSKRRKRWFGAADECLLWDERFDDRFVDDGVLTGAFRDPFADPHANVVPKSVNLFEGDNPPVRGDNVRIVWPTDSDKDPSVTFDDEFPDGICITGGTGTVSTVDLPMRVVMRVDRKSIGLDADENGEETMIAWVKPEEVASL
ncbi:hypothetical protein ACHAXT_003090 [Thalassiosira profunda]